MFVNEQCYYRLKIDTTDALNPSWSMPVPKNNYGIWAPLAENIFSKTWLEYTAGLGIDFKHAFINSIQKFKLPDKYLINHNDLSNFSRFFYPYISLVIDPRKRQAKIKKEESKSKYGTYLRYKRVSKYDNQTGCSQLSCSS